MTARPIPLFGVIERSRKCRSILGIPFGTPGIAWQDSLRLNVASRRTGNRASGDLAPHGAPSGAPSLSRRACLPGEFSTHAEPRRSTERKREQREQRRMKNTESRMQNADVERHCTFIIVYSSLFILACSSLCRSMPTIWWTYDGRAAQPAHRRLSLPHPRRAAVNSIE
jgi:hypothetical protein